MLSTSKERAVLDCNQGTLDFTHYSTVFLGSLMMNIHVLTSSFRKKKGKEYVVIDRVIIFK